jgi:GT2 family glycosyltransferase
MKRSSHMNRDDQITSTRRTSPAHTAPIAVRAVDIDKPVGDLVVPASRSGQPYGSLLVVPRLHGSPLGTLSVDLTDEGRVSAEHLSSVIWDGMAQEIGAHLDADRIVVPTGPEIATPVAAECRDAPLETGPLASVIVNTCADVDATLRCLTALLAMPYTPFEVIVVENRPAGSMVRPAVAERFGDDGRVRVVDEPRRGLATARNAGLREAEGEIIAVLDDDVVVDPAWLGHVARRFRDEPAVACVSGLILPAELESPEQLLIERFAAFGKGFSPRTFSLERAPEGDRLFPYACGAFGSGANTVLRAEAADLLGGFEETLGTGTPARGGEDLDLFIRLLLAGQAIAYEPAAVVWHRHPSGPGAPKRQAINYGIGLSAMLTHRWVAGGDRARMLRAVPAGVGYLRDSNSRRNVSRGRDFPRSLSRWERLGLAAGPFAYLISRARGARQARASFTPTCVDELDLRQPLTDRPVPRRRDGKRYRAARLLVRSAGEPLGLLDLELTTGTLRAGRVETAVEERFAGAAELVDLSGHGPSDGLGTSRSTADISVVVCTHERADSLRATLTSILRTSPEPLEVLVVDNAPATDRTRAVVAELGDRRLRYVVEPVQGLSRARNRGVAESRGAVVAFTDDDVVVDQGWLGGLGQGFARAPEVAAVTGLVATAELDSAAQGIFDSSVAWSANCTPQLWDLSTPPRGDVLFPFTAGKFGTGANFALKREPASAVGPFDEALGAGTPTAGGEDLDMFLRVLLCGFKLAYEPSALVWHRHRQEPEALREQMFGYGSGLSAYAYKHLVAPQTRAGVARRVPRALLHAARRAGRGGPPNASRRTMMRAELLGYACGPTRYRRSRRAVVQHDRANAER